ncbi:hypothetical protein [Sinorhizobium meliloti]|uniref:hypothetical protein n=1 Tax=Rhizobium meliloti TaxID=382 RepID=UPI00299F5227|nr:hypothetical protein [Sinorhizobium meliloti]MDW9991054.1 hypothetical protein [Sinorhizobium meliloti]MDX0245454.1 hypothetical protein [Sinorhizobium meliloti]MDX0401542.1 hypothetical protein [Sinorhizobium meliloti]
MEDELSNNSEMETATLSNEDILAQFEATLDMPEASDNSEQADEHVEEPDADENASETPSDTDEPVFEIDGEQLPLSEVRNRMMRQADYTRKTQELAEQRKAYQEAQFDKNQLRMEALQGIEALKQQMAIEFSMMPPEPNWDELLKEDPHSYMLAQREWQRREAYAKQVWEAEVALRTQAEAYENEQHQLEVQECQKRLLEKYPELRDRSTATQVLGEMSELLQSYRLTQKDVEGLYDDRVISIIYDFNKLLKAQKAIPEVVAKMEQKPVISQKQNSSKASDAYTRDFNKFNKSRNGNDAIALISRLL